MTANSALDELIDQEIAKPRYQRRSRRLSAMFLDATEPSRKRSVNLSFMLIFPFYALFFLFDIYLIPDVIGYSVLFRFIVTPLVWLVMALKRKSSAHFLEWSIVIVTMIGFTMWTALLVLSKNQSGVQNYYYAGALFAVVCNVFFRCPFQLSLSLSVIMTVVLVAVGAYLARAGGTMPFTTASSLIVAVCILTLISNWSLGNERYAFFLQTLKTERQQATIERHSAELFRLSNTDALTGLANRRSIDEALQRLWRGWTEQQDAFATILIDVDFFKRYNDGMGHQAGDSCLVDLARVLLQAAARHTAIAGRYGGEEFIVLLPFEQPHDAIAFAEDLRRAVEDLDRAHEWRPDAETRVTVSVGMALTHHLVDADPLTLVSFADKALYRAKADGRNTVRLFAAEDQTGVTLAA